MTSSEDRFTVFGIMSRPENDQGMSGIEMPSST